MADILNFRDEAGIERLVGTLHDPGATPGDVLTVNPDGSVSAAPGGGGAPPEVEEVSGTMAAVTPGSYHALDWGASSGPDSLLDLTVPTAPLVLVAGIYAITLCASQQNPSTLGGSVFLGVASALMTQIQTAAVPATPATGGVSVTLVSAFGEKGGDLTLAAQLNPLIAETDDWAIQALIVRLA